MARSPYLAMFTRDITSRKNVKLLRSAGKAVWAWVLFNMHIEGVWQMRHTPEEYAIILDLPADEVTEGINQMEAQGVGHIERHDDGSVTITSNRMRRDMQKREKTRKRVERFREGSNDDDEDEEALQRALPHALQESLHPPLPSRAGARAENESENERVVTGKEGVQGEKGKKGEDDRPAWAPSEEAAVDWFTSHAGLTYGGNQATVETEARKFWAHYDAREWLDKYERPLRNWRSLAKSWMLRKGEFEGSGAGKKSEAASLDAFPEMGR